MRRLIVGLTGATGAILGVRLLEALKDSKVESHLIISNWGRRTIEHETPYTVKQKKHPRCELAIDRPSSPERRSCQSALERDPGSACKRVSQVSHNVRDEGAQVPPMA